MLFIILTFLAALLLEGIGTIVSIQGLTLLFGDALLIIALAIAFDFGKLVSVSLLYKEWRTLPKMLRRYLFAASAVLMTITSAGGAGFLSAASQKALLPTKSIQVQVDAITAEKQKLETRKREIDLQISNLPPDMVKGRTKLINSFKVELEHVNTRLIELDQQLPKLQVELIEKSSHSGPITYIAEATGKTAETAMSYIIGLIIFVFDPLAVALILAGNYLVEKRQQRPVIQPLDTTHVVEEVIPEVTEEFNSIEQDVIIESKVENPIHLQLADNLHFNSVDEGKLEDTDQQLYKMFPAEMIDQAKSLAASVDQPRAALADINYMPGSEVTFYDETANSKIFNEYKNQ
jgi:hypothetical protein